LGRGGRATPYQLRARAKRMRSAPTDAEHRLWQVLRAKRLSSYKCKRQLPIDGYVVDFVCLQHRLIVEADGGHHGDEADKRRTAYLKAQGFRILRFWNNDILNNEEGVLQCILDALSPLSPTPLPQGGEGL
jgi:very-short-patch-repair endonuclease